MARSDLLIVLGLAGVAFSMRREGLGPGSLWLDDAWVAAGASEARWDQLLSVGLMSPGFGLLLRLFVVLGDGAPLAAQLLPLAAGLAAPGLLYLALVDRGLRRVAALVPAIVLLSAPFHVTYSVFVKQYTVEVLLSIALVWSAWTVLDDGPSRRRWGRLLLIAGASFAISAPVWPVIAVAVPVAAWAAWRRGDDRRWIAATTAGTAAFGLAWAALVVLPRVNDLLHDYWVGKYIVTDRGVRAAATSAVERLEAAVSGFTRLDRRWGLLGVAAAAAVVLWRRPALGMLLFGPVVIAVGLAAAELSPLGTGRTDMYLYPPVLVLVGVALDAVADVLWRPVGASVLVVALVAACAGAVGVDQAPYPTEDIRPLVRIWESQRRDGDVTVVYPMASFAFALYADTPVELVPSSEYGHGYAIASQDPDVHVLPNRTADPTEYEPFVRDAVEGRDRVWFLASHVSADAAAEIRQQLRTLGFSRQSSDRRRGALLDLWVRGEGAPPNAA